MSVPLWAIEMAAAFWRDAGGEEDVPRGLRRPIAIALPLTVVSLPRLRLAGIDAWLRNQDIHCRLDVPDRPLRACLVAQHGQGFVFIDGTDAEDEQRFSLAHETAHFLREYQGRRQVAVGRLGPRILEVLDGDRPARPEERIDALLARVPIGLHVHLMDRADDGQYASAAIDAAERDADLLAYELLAPSGAVLGEVAPYPPAEQRAAATDRLVTTYRLPPRVARRYAAFLVPSTDRSDSFIRRLGLAP